MNSMNITIRPLTLADKNLFYAWWNDLEIRALTAQVTEILTNKEIDEMIAENLVDQNNAEFIIEVDCKPIGHIRIKENNRKRYFMIDTAIGEKDYWGKGIGTIALNLAVEWFTKNHPDEEALELEVNTDNPRAIRCYEKVGFCKIAKKHYNGFKDTYLMRLMINHSPLRKCTFKV